MLPFRVRAETGTTVASAALATVTVAEAVAPVGSVRAALPDAVTVTG